MTILMKRALEAAKALPESQQDVVAQELLNAINTAQDEAHWDAQFAVSHDVLVAMASEARAEHAAGKTMRLP